MYVHDKQQKTTQSRYPLTDRDTRMIVLSCISLIMCNCIYCNNRIPFNLDLDMCSKVNFPGTADPILCADHLIRATFDRIVMYVHVDAFSDVASDS